MDKDKQIKDLCKALEPFAMAHDRLRSYGEDPYDDAPLHAVEDNCTYELLNGEDGSQVTVGDLRIADELLQAINAG